MAAPLSILSDIDAADWVAGRVIREGPLREQVLQNLQYLIDQLSNVVESNFWLLYAQQLSVGDVLGTPFA